MYRFFKTSIFERNAKQCIKKHRNMDDFKDAVLAVLNSDETPIGAKYNDHALKGDLQGKRVVHVGGRKSDWLILYCLEDDLISFERTGSHDELFR